MHRMPGPGSPAASATGVVVPLLSGEVAQRPRAPRRAGEARRKKTPSSLELGVFYWFKRRSGAALATCSQGQTHQTQAHQGIG